MPRKRSEKKIYMKWSVINMEKAVKDVMEGRLSTRGASGLYSIPYTTLQNKIKKVEYLQLGLNPSIGDTIGHPTVLSSEQEKALVSRLLALESRGLGLTPLQIRRTAFDFAEMNQIKHPWNLENKVAGIDWFRAFMRRHENLSIRKPEGLSRARAQGLNRR